MLKIYFYPEISICNSLHIFISLSIPWVTKFMSLMSYAACCISGAAGTS